MATDGILFQRIIENLLKNALEASGEDEAIEVRLEFEETKGIHFSVRNKAVMPLEIQQQVFQRSFSTKGEGRGLGTYSVKLFAETYLHGKVWFESTAAGGTVFHVTLPRRESC